MSYDFMQTYLACSWIELLSGKNTKITSSTHRIFLYREYFLSHTIEANTAYIALAHVHAFAALDGRVLVIAVVFYIFDIRTAALQDQGHRETDNHEDAEEQQRAPVLTPLRGIFVQLFVRPLPRLVLGNYKVRVHTAAIVLIPQMEGS